MSIHPDVDRQLMILMMCFLGTKRIQPARGWCAAVGGDCANCIPPFLPLPEARPPVFFGKPVMRPRSMVGHTGHLDISREGGASAGQVERTPDRATLNSWVV